MGAAPRREDLESTKEIYITENGCSSSDIPARTTDVYDNDRVMYLRNYLTQLQRATADGVPVGLLRLEPDGQFRMGRRLRQTRFGLHYVDYKTQKRTPKLSASWFKEAARRNAVV